MTEKYMRISPVLVSIGWQYLNHLQYVSNSLPDIIAVANEPNITLMKDKFS